MSRLRVYTLIILAVWLGFILRLHNLDSVPLRGDEAFSAMFWAEMPIHQSLAEIATIEPHPPLTYVIFHAWNLAIGGIESPFALRMLGVLGNLIGIAVMYALTKRITQNTFLGLVAGLMWATHPFEIWHSQDFRNYALWATLSVMTIWLGLRLITLRRRVDWVLYIFFAIISVFTFYTELLMLGALGLYVLITQRRRPKFLISFLSTQASIIGAVLVGFFILQGSLLTSGGYGGNVEPFSAPDYLTRFLPTLVWGETIPAAFVSIWIILLVICVIFCGVIFLYQRKLILLFFLLSIIPLLLLGMASLRISIFHPRYVMAVVPAFLLLLIVGSYFVAQMLNQFLKINSNIITLILLSPWFIIASITINNYYTNPALRKAPAWNELTDFLNINVTIDDLVIQLSTDAAFGYYYDGDALDRGLPASPVQPKDEIVKILETARTQYNSIYVVSNTIPNWENSDVVEAWANDHMQLVRLSNASGLGIRQYKNWDELESSGEILTNFEDVVELVGYHFFDTPLPTGEFALWLDWNPLSQTSEPIKSFVHLVGAINPQSGSPLWEQDDQFPQAGRLDTTSWDIGTTYRDVYYLPSDSLIAGDYQIMVGWYYPETNVRLLTDNDFDAFTVTTFTYP